MPLRILPVEEADVPAVRNVILTAFSEDPFSLAVFPRAQIHAYIGWYNSRLFSQLQDPSVRLLKVIDTDLGPNHIIAHGRWTFPTPHAKGPLDTRQEVEVTAQKEKPEGTWPNFKWPEPMNKKLIEDYWAASKQWRKDSGLDATRDYVLEMLVTLQEHRGKGAARLLLDYGIMKARDEGAMIFLESTPIAYPVYLAQGFKASKKFTMDLSNYGVEGGKPYEWTFLVRCPWDES